MQVILECSHQIGPKCLPLNLYAELATVLANGLIQPRLPKFINQSEFKSKSLKKINSNKNRSEFFIVICFILSSIIK